MKHFLNGVDGNDMIGGPSGSGGVNTNLLTNSQKVSIFNNNNGVNVSTMYNTETPIFYTIVMAAPISAYENNLYTAMVDRCIIGQTYTVGVDVRVASVVDVSFINSVYTQAIPANKWTRMTFTFTYSNELRIGGFECSLGTLDYRNFKLEKGSTATDWCPAPEDLSSKLSISDYTPADIAYRLRQLTPYEADLNVKKLDGLTADMVETRRTKDVFNSSLSESTLREIAITGRMMNKLRFIPAFLQEQSDDGITWITSTRINASDLANLMLGEGEANSVNIFPSPMTVGNKGYYRLTWDQTQTGYCYLNFLSMYMATCSNDVKFSIEGYHNTSLTWIKLAEDTINNWPGVITLDHEVIAFGPQAEKYGKVRINFEMASAANTYDVELYNIEWYGTYPYQTKNIFSWDKDKNAIFPAYVTGEVLVSSTPQGTAPFIVTSETMVEHLNANYVGSYTADDLTSVVRWRNEILNRNRILSMGGMY